MRIAMILPLVALAACAGHPVRESAISSNCPGQRSVIVSNDWRYTVDVYASRGAILGSVEPGRQHEFILPDDATYAYVRASPHVRTWRTPNRQAVRFRYLCR